MNDYRIEIYENGKYEAIFDSRFDKNPKRFASLEAAEAFASEQASHIEGGSFEVTEV